MSSLLLNRASASSTLIPVGNLIEHRPGTILYSLAMVVRAGGGLLKFWFDLGIIWFGVWRCGLGEWLFVLLVTKTVMTLRVQGRRL